MSGKGTVAEAQKATGSVKETQAYQSKQSTQQTTQTKSNVVDCEKAYDAKGGDKDWEMAKKKTDEAERLAREAQINACKATNTVETVTSAKSTQEEAYARKVEAEREADKLKGKIDTSSEAHRVAGAQDRVGEKEQEVAAAKRTVAQTDAERRAKEAEAARLAGSVQEKERLLESLEAQYDRYSREKDEAAAQLKEFEKAAEQAAKDVHDLRQDTHKWESELEKAGELIRQKERELAEAREKSTRVSARLGNLKSELAAAEKDNDHLIAEVKKFNRIVEDKKAKEADLAQRLSELRKEYDAAKKALDARQKEADRARQAFENLKKTVGPASKELEDARVEVMKAERELAEAQALARQHEGAYSRLLREADEQNKVAAVAATTIEKKTAIWREMKADIERLRREEDAKWAEAKQYGDRADKNTDRELQAAEARLSKFEKDAGKSTSYDSSQSSFQSHSGPEGKEVVKSSGAASGAAQTSGTGYSRSEQTSASYSHSESDSRSGNNPVQTAKTVFGRFTEPDEDTRSTEAEKQGIRLL
jgi:chromosome segregation ATPase